MADEKPDILPNLITFGVIGVGIWLFSREPSGPELQRRVYEDARRRRGGLSGLPKHGRIPLKTAKRALKRLSKRSQACSGLTPDSLREGMEIEREHRDVTKGAVLKTAKIAAAHICERPDYYKRIKKYVEG